MTHDAAKNERCGAVRCGDELDDDTIHNSRSILSTRLDSSLSSLWLLLQAAITGDRLGFILACVSVNGQNKERGARFYVNSGHQDGRSSYLCASSFPTPCPLCTPSPPTGSVPSLSSSLSPAMASQLATCRACRKSRVLGKPGSAINAQVMSRSVRKFGN